MKLLRHLLAIPLLLVTPALAQQATPISTPPDDGVEVIATPEASPASPDNDASQTTADSARRFDDGDINEERKPRETKEPETIAKTPDDMSFVESNVVALAGREGFSWQDRKGHFLFSPYLLVQTRLQFQYFDDEGLNLADPDNVRGVGFGIPNGIIGFAGHAFEFLSYNLALNASCAGKGCLLYQASLETNVSKAFRIQAGKFKTPMHWNVLARAGQKLSPIVPQTLTTPVNAPFDLNANNPTMATGFDLGLMVHGVVADSLQYQVGVFNGEGMMINTPTSTLSDDMRLPALLYSARLAWMPLGEMLLQEGGFDTERPRRLSVGASASYNVEANSESSNDFRSGLELVYTSGGLYAAAEAYLLHTEFVERQREMPNLLYAAGYAQLAYSFGFKLEPWVRTELFDRNSTDEPGMLVMPAIGANYFFFGDNVKLQALYQPLFKVGHETQSAANDDDNGLAEHLAALQLQFSL